PIPITIRTHRNRPAPHRHLVLRNRRETQSPDFRASTGSLLTFQDPRLKRSAALSRLTWSLSASVNFQGRVTPFREACEDFRRVIVRKHWNCVRNAERQGKASAV